MFGVIFALVAPVLVLSAQAQTATKPRMDFSIPSGALVLHKGTIFLIMNGEQIPFASMAAFTGLGYQTKYVRSVDLSEYPFTQTKGIFSSAVGHTWGSWLLHKGTVYYSHRDGLIPVPDWGTFLENGGFSAAIVPVNSYDLEVLRQSPAMPPLQKWDSRVWLFAPEQVAVRDQVRVERVQKLQQILSTYKTAVGTHPTSLETLIPQYMPSLPPPVFPPDGPCTTGMNEFTYTKTATGYAVGFCLGAPTGGYVAGLNTAGPDQ